MHGSALACKLDKSKSCCKINYKTCKYVFIAHLECCAVHDEKTMYGHGN